MGGSAQKRKRRERDMEGRSRDRMEVPWPPASYPRATARDRPQESHEVRLVIRFGCGGGPAEFVIVICDASPAAVSTR